MSAVAQPKVQPLERFWPYEDVAEQLSVEEQAALDPELYEALYGRRDDRPFSITLLFADLDLPGFERALALARQASAFVDHGAEAPLRYRARFVVHDAARLREVFNVVGRSPKTEILVDDRAWPYGRELWIPLFGFFVHA